MKTIMNIKNLKTIEQISGFLEGTQPLIFEPASSKAERYVFVRQILVQLNYCGLKKSEKGQVILFLLKLTKYSEPQLKRLIKQYKTTGIIVSQQKTRHCFQKKYTNADIALLAEMDRRYDNLSGAVIKKLCERHYTIFGEEKYVRLASISVSHLYNLRESKHYQCHYQTFTKTRGKKGVDIGVRRRPTPNNQPGYLRVDTVHQGDLDRVKGVYHINMVDEVTHFEMVYSVEGISEAFLKPVLSASMHDFPFEISGFHSDNGSEYINGVVAKLLDKLKIEFTKSRSRKSTDNALAESKNASVVRKCWGYQHIPQCYAERLNDFNQKHLNIYINYHRPCYFPKTIVDAKGKEKKAYKYEDMMTPYEKLKSLPNAESFLRPGVTFEDLDKMAYRVSDNEICDKMNEAKFDLLQWINNEEQGRA